MAEEMNNLSAEQNLTETKITENVPPAGAVAAEAENPAADAPRRPGRPKGSKNKKSADTGMPVENQESPAEEIKQAASPVAAEAAVPAEPPAVQKVTPTPAPEEEINMENVRPDALVAPANAIAAPMNAVSFGPPEDETL